MEPLRTSMDILNRLIEVNTGLELIGSDNSIVIKMPSYRLFHQISCDIDKSSIVGEDSKNIHEMLRILINSETTSKGLIAGLKTDITNAIESLPELSILHKSILKVIQLQESLGIHTGSAL